MSQISRPFQIALLAIGLLAAVWLVAFQQHSSSPSAPAATATVVSSSPSTSPAAEAKAAASPTSVYKGSAPGVQGLSRAIANAHKAVATSQQNANQLQAKSAQATNEPASSAGASSAAATTPAATPSTAASAPTHTASTATKSAPATSTQSTKAVITPTPSKAKKTSSPSSSSSSSVPAGQRKVESEIAAGDVVAILFWNPQGADDVAVHRELQLLSAVHRSLRPYAGKPLVKRLLKAFGQELAGKLAVNEAPASQAASFGTITRTIQVYGTPTLLLIGKQGKTIVLSGLQDAFSIQQALDEAHAA